MNWVIVFLALIGVVVGASIVNYVQERNRKNEIAANKRLIAMWELEALAKNLTKEKILGGL